MRGENISYYHYIIHEPSDDGWSEPIYFKTNKEITKKYNVSRTTIFRMIKDPLFEPKYFKCIVEKCLVHTSTIQQSSSTP